jgi:hypothetical protein
MPKEGPFIVGAVARMRSVFILSVAALAVLDTVVAAQSPPAPKTVPPAQVRYDSPQAVFESYRQAIAKGDVRTQVLCHAREIREDAYQMLTEALLSAACAPRHEPKVTAVLKKFKLDMTAIEAEYTKQYKAKHGVDPETVQAEYKKKFEHALSEYLKAHPKENRDSPLPWEEATKRAGPWPEQVDEAIMRKIVDAAVPDKTGFAIAVQEALTDPSETRDKPGQLTNVRITGDHATGESESTSYHIENTDGRSDRKVIDRFKRNYQFRKTSEGWLISGFGGGDAATPRPNPAKDSAPPQTYIRP